MLCIAVTAWEDLIKSNQDPQNYMPSFSKIYNPFSEGLITRSVNLVSRSFHFLLERSYYMLLPWLKRMSDILSSPCQCALFTPSHCDVNGMGMAKRLRDFDGDEYSCHNWELWLDCIEIPSHIFSGEVMLTHFSSSLSFFRCSHCKTF